jgi:hypothetical protein
VGGGGGHRRRLNNHPSSQQCPQQSTFVRHVVNYLKKTNFPRFFQENKFVFIFYAFFN